MDIFHIHCFFLVNGIFHIHCFFSSQWTFSTSISDSTQTYVCSLSSYWWTHFPHSFRIPRRLTNATLAIIGGRIFHRLRNATLAIIGGRIFLISFVESLRWRMLLLPHSLTERAKQLSNFSIFLISNVIYIYIIFFKYNSKKKKI